MPDAVEKNDNWMDILSSIFMPITTGLTSIIGNDTPVRQMLTGDGSAFAGATAAASGTGPLPSAAGSSSDISGANIPMTTTVEGEGGTSDIDTALADALQGSTSVSEYIKNNPGKNVEDILSYMATQNDEWAEKYLNYYLEKKGIEDANAYTASREDTAYQRLTADLRAAGLNPAMMYGSSASTHASGSSGVLSTSGSATSSSISNFAKIKKLILAYMVMQISAATGLTNSIGKSFTSLLGLL